MNLDLDDLFAEPRQMEEEEEPEYPFVQWGEYNIRLMNRHHSLWGDKVAPAATITADLIKQRKFGIDVSDCTVIEFGSGSALCSVVAASQGASFVLATDYPDAPIIENIAYNLQRYHNAQALGHMWGKDTLPLLSVNSNTKYDYAILSDVIFNHVSQRALLNSLVSTLKPTGTAIVVFTHHRPHLVKEDLKFFELATNEFNLMVRDIGAVEHRPMFQNDLGSSEIRSVAYIKFLTFSETQ